MVMIKTHADGQFQPIYKGYYRIVSFKGNQVPKREVLPQPLTLLRLHICDQEPRDYLITIATSVAV